MASVGGRPKFWAVVAQIVGSFVHQLPGSSGLLQAALRESQNRIDEETDLSWELGGPRAVVRCLASLEVRGQLPGWGQQSVFRVPVKMGARLSCWTQDLGPPAGVQSDMEA